MKDFALCNEGTKQPGLLIAGGDDRLVELALIYREKGFLVSTFGMDKISIDGIKNYDTLDEALENSDTVICPVPFSKDATKLNTKYSSKDIYIEEFFRKLKSGKTLLVGAINNYSKELALKYGISYIDYYNDEGYQIMNTVPTVEGALSIIINETPKTLFGSKILVLGYGRIGKLLSEYLRMLGADTFVEARKDSDLAWIAAKGMKAVPLWNLDKFVGYMDVIVNTVPALILGSSILKLIRKDALLLDLASNPGGIDYKYAEENGLKAVHALGIPGKVACRSAAMYIYETIEKLCYKCHPERK